MFRCFLPGRGSDGKGLVQAYGMSARRIRPAEDRNKPQVPMKPGSPHMMYPPSDEPWGEWEVSGPKLLTIDVGDLKIKK